MSRLTRRQMLALSALALTGCATDPIRQAPRTSSPDSVLTRIAFGSCARQKRPQPIWEAVCDARPEVFLFLGDAVYADTEDMSAMAAAYARLAAQPGFRRLKAESAVLATWDDHDFGADDVGGEYPMKHESRRQFLDFFGEAPNSPRRTQEGGIYASYFFGPPGRRVQIVLLDTRFERTPVLFVPESDAAERARRRARKIGYRVANSDPAARILADAQWAWLDAELRKPADVRLICTSVPFVMDFTGTETWSNFPLEKERMVRTIDRTGAECVLFLSGDPHWADISRRDDGTPYPLWDATSSALNQSARRISPNRYRIGDAYAEPNFGTLEIDWNGPASRIRMSIRDVHGRPFNQREAALADLRFSARPKA